MIPLQTKIKREQYAAEKQTVGFHVHRDPNHNFRQSRNVFYEILENYLVQELVLSFLAGKYH